jgi:hypothetical protein
VEGITAWVSPFAGNASVLDAGRWSERPPTGKRCLAAQKGRPEQEIAISSQGAILLDRVPPGDEPSGLGSPSVLEAEGRREDELMRDFSAEYRAAIEASLREFVNNGDDVVCIGYFVYNSGQCKMCDHVPIKWHYVLENLRSRKTLIVGSECVENYQRILSEWGYRPEYLVFPTFLRAYARWILEKNPNAVVFDDGIVMRFRVDCDALMRANIQSPGLQHYRYLQRATSEGSERVAGVDEVGRVFPIGPSEVDDYDTEFVEYEPDMEEEDEERELYEDLGLDPDDPDFGELAAEGLDPDKYDWESHDYDPD